MLLARAASKLVESLNGATAGTKRTPCETSCGANNRGRPANGTTLTQLPPRSSSICDTREDARRRSSRVMLAEVSTSTTAPTFVRGNIRVGSASAAKIALKLAAFNSKGKRRAVVRQT